MVSRPHFDLFARDLGAFPSGYAGNPLHLLWLDDAQRIASARLYRRALDAPHLQQEQREYLFGAEASAWMFPTAAIDGRPDPWELSHWLFTRFERARDVLATQRDIAPLLAARAARCDADFIVLMICDGLSYYDLPDDLIEREDIAPCLVDGVSVTQWGYRQAVGKPSLSQRLFAQGYGSQLGLSYFDPAKNELAGDLFGDFGALQTRKIVSFEEGLQVLRDRRAARGFVQWTVAGLDGLSHHHRDAPPRGAYLNEIVARFDALCDVLSRGGRRVLACLTADHGLLWREHLDKFGGAQVVNTLLPEDVHHPRYVKGSLARSFARVVACDGVNYSLFRAPSLTRALRVDEWGVHGGISAWESLVPLWVREI